MDFSFSHAIAGRTGPAYAGTFNLSIGNNGNVNGSYGGVLANGGAVRSVEAGGATRSSSPAPTAVATARGDASPNGTVIANTRSYNTRPQYYRPVVVRRLAPRYGR